MLGSLALETGIEVGHHEGIRCWVPPIDEGFWLGNNVGDGIK